MVEDSDEEDDEDDEDDVTYVKDATEYVKLSGALLKKEDDDDDDVLNNLINGNYKKTSVTSNNRPVYQKVDMQTIKMWYKDGNWVFI